MKFLTQILTISWEETLIIIDIIPLKKRKNLQGT